LFEHGLSGKWLELKQIAPSVRRVALLRDSTMASGIGQFGYINGQAALGGSVEIDLFRTHPAMKLAGANLHALIRWQG
jgi:hypothetical protein